MGTERVLLLLVIEAAVVLRWWFKRKKAKQAWSQGLFEERAGSPAAASAKRVPHDALLSPLRDGHRCEQVWGAEAKRHQHTSLFLPSFSRPPPSLPSTQPRPFTIAIPSWWKGWRRPRPLMLLRTSRFCRQRSSCTAEVYTIQTPSLDWMIRLNREIYFLMKSLSSLQTSWHANSYINFWHTWYIFVFLVPWEG